MHIAHSALTWPGFLRMNAPHELTTLLQDAGAGDPQAQRALYDLAYAELKRIARATLKRAGAGQNTLNPTMLVHEAYAKIAQGAVQRINDSQHFYSLFARAMRQVLLDISRQRGTVKHGSGQLRAELDELIPDAPKDLDQLLEIDRALTQLEQTDAQLAQLVEWHFFAGLSFVDIAAARGVTERTVRRHWEMARLLLLDSVPGLLDSRASAGVTG